MKKLLFTFIIIALLTEMGSVQMASAQDEGPGQSESESGSVVCPPGIYSQDPVGCLPLGPASTLTQKSISGLYPPSPKVDYTPEYALNYVPYNYFRVDEAGTSVFILGDAEAIGCSFQIGPACVRCYTTAWRLERGYYYLTNGTWIPGDGDASRRHSREKFSAPHLEQDLAGCSPRLEALGDPITLSITQKSGPITGPISCLCMNPKYSMAMSGC
jgi:hypothetical protein